MNQKKQYLEFCEKNFGKKVDDIRVWRSSDPDLPDVSVLIWQDCPEPGIMTAVSYGLSLMKHTEWTKGRPELMIRLETEDITWALSMAYFIDSFRKEKIFKYLTILTMDEKISDESEMRGFLVFGPPLIDGEDMDFPTDDIPIKFAGFYPIYLEEAKAIQKYGLEAFWRRDDYDIYSVNRPVFKG